MTQYSLMKDNRTIKIGIREYNLLRHSGLYYCVYDSMLKCRNAIVQKDHLEIKDGGILVGLEAYIVDNVDTAVLRRRYISHLSHALIIDESDNNLLEKKVLLDGDLVPEGLLVKLR